MNEKYTNLYSVSKTVRFKLIPVGKTLENMEAKDVFKEDVVRAENYKEMKKMLDECHRDFIEKFLTSVYIEPQDLKDFKEAYKAKDKDKIKAIQEKLRNALKRNLTANPDLSKAKDCLTGKGIINLLNEKFPEKSENIVSTFDGFTTYFTGFNDNRENIYSEEEKPCSIGYRLFNENLPKFADNIFVYEKNKDVIDKFNIQELLNYLNKSSDKVKISCAADIFAIENFSFFISESGIQMYNALLRGVNPDGSNSIPGINGLINEYNNQKDIKKISKMTCLFKQILSDEENLSYSLTPIEDDTQCEELIKSVLLQFNKEFIEKNCNDVLFKNTYDNSKIYIKDQKSLSLLSCKYFDYDYNLISKAITYKKNEKVSLERVVSFNLPEKVYKDISEREQEYLKKYNALLEAFNKREGNSKIQQDNNLVGQIKDTLTDVMEIEQLVRCFDYQEDDDKDASFYNELNNDLLLFSDVQKAYNLTRNYLTQKPYSTEKIKLNFSNSQLLAGWDKNKEKDYNGIILMKDRKYYLGIIDKNNSRCMQTFEEGESNYKKMVYKQIPGFKGLPKYAFAKKYTEILKPSKEILSIYENESYKKNNKNFNVNDCRKLIDYYKYAISMNKEWDVFNFKFSDTSSYNDLSDFTRELENQSYNISFVNVDEKYINQLVDNGHLYLFEIYNKDFAENAKGKKNLHTMYWNGLFSERNLKECVYKLNGQGEIFYRKKSYVPGPNDIHKAGNPIAKRSDPDSTSLFDYDLIKNKRYTIDQMEFHVSVKMNTYAPGNVNLNQMVIDDIRNSADTYVIGVDRGERNLLYISVINQKGEIVEQKSLNIISNEYNGKKYNVDYQKLLSDRENERMTKRKNWGTIENIKELKSGYMSQIVNIISKLMMKYNAILVLENLDGKFKNSRAKIEKQVYQNFETALISKLSYLVDKEKQEDEAGGLYNALQFVNNPGGLFKSGIQNGKILYIPAWKTSKVDPTTGYTNLLDTSYSSISDSKDFVKKFDSIVYDDKLEAYCFTLNKESGGWKIYSNGERIVSFINKDKFNHTDYKVIDLNHEYNHLFADYSIDKNKNLKEQILNQSSKDFFEKFMNTFRYTVQLRNSSSYDDYILSPVMNSKGEFFDTRKGNPSLPLDADANGAYNIALKGLMLVNRIKNDSKGGKGVKLAITNEKSLNEEWLDYLKNR